MVRQAKKQSNSSNVHFHLNSNINCNLSNAISINKNVETNLCCESILYQNKLSDVYSFMRSNEGSDKKCDNCCESQLGKKKKKMVIKNAKSNNDHIVDRCCVNVNDSTNEYSDNNKSINDKSRKDKSFALNYSNKSNDNRNNNVIKSKRNSNIKVIRKSSHSFSLPSSLVCPPSLLVCPPSSLYNPQRILKQSCTFDQSTLKKSRHFSNHEINSEALVSKTSNFECCSLLASPHFSNSPSRLSWLPNLSYAEGCFYNSFSCNQNSSHLKLGHVTTPRSNAISLPIEDDVDEFHCGTSNLSAANTWATATFSAFQASSFPSTFCDNESTMDSCYVAFSHYDVAPRTLMNSSSVAAPYCSPCTTTPATPACFVSSFTPQSASMCYSVNTSSAPTMSAIFSAQAVSCAANTISSFAETKGESSCFPIHSASIASSQNYYPSIFDSHCCQPQSSFLSRSTSAPYFFLSSSYLHSSSSSDTSQRCNCFFPWQRNFPSFKSLLRCSNKNLKSLTNKNRNDILCNEDGQESSPYKNFYKYKEHDVGKEKLRSNTVPSELACLEAPNDEAWLLDFKNTDFLVTSRQKNKENDNFICNLQNKRRSGAFDRSLFNNIKQNSFKIENICVNDEQGVQNNEPQSSSNNIYPVGDTFNRSKNDAPTIKNNAHKNDIKRSGCKNCLKHSNKSSNKINNDYTSCFVQAPYPTKDFENVINMCCSPDRNSKTFNAVSSVRAMSIYEKLNNNNNQNNKKLKNIYCNVKKFGSSSGDGVADSTNIHKNGVLHVSSTETISKYDFDDQNINNNISNQKNKNMTHFLTLSQSSDSACVKGAEVHSNSTDMINFDQMNNEKNYNDFNNKMFIESDRSEKLNALYSSIYINNDNEQNCCKQNNNENAQTIIKEKRKNEKKEKTLKEEDLEQQQKKKFKGETTAKSMETVKDKEKNNFFEKYIQKDKRKCLLFVYVKKFAIVFLDLWGGDDFAAQQKQQSEISLKFKKSDNHKDQNKCDHSNIDFQLYNKTNGSNKNFRCNEEKKNINKKKNNNNTCVIILKIFLELCKRVFFHYTKNLWSKIISVLKHNRTVIVQEPNNKEYTNYNESKDNNVKSLKLLLNCKPLSNNCNKINCISSKNCHLINSFQECLQLNGSFSNFLRKNIFFGNGFFKHSRHHTFCTGKTQKRKEKVMKAEEEWEAVNGENKKRKIFDSLCSKNCKMFDSNVTKKQGEDFNNNNFNGRKCEKEALNETNSIIRIKSTSSTNISGINGSKESYSNLNTKMNKESGASINFLNASTNMKFKKEETTNVELLSFWNKQTEKSYRNYLNGFYPFRMLVVGIMLIIFEIFQILCSLIYKGGGVRNTSHYSYPSSMNPFNQQIHSSPFTANGSLNEKADAASSRESVWFVKMPESIFTATMVTFVSNIVIYGVFSISGKIHFLKNHLEFSAVTLNAVAFILKFSNSLTVCLLTIKNRDIFKAASSAINNDHGSAITCTTEGPDSTNNDLHIFPSSNEDDEYALEGEYLDTTTSVLPHKISPSFSNSNLSDADSFSTLPSPSPSSFPKSYAFDLFEGEFAILAFSIALNIIVIDLMLPVRTKVSIWLHVLYLGANFILVVIVKELYSLEFSQIWHISVVCSCIIVIFGLMGRVQAEISHRRLYNKWIKSDERFKDLEEKIKSNHKGSTGVEKLVNYVNQSELILRKVMIKNNDELLQQVLDFHAKIMETVTDGVNMYKLRLDLHDEHFSKVLKYIPGDPCLDICTPRRSFSEKYIFPEDNKMKLKSKSQILTTDDKLALFLPLDDIFFRPAESTQKNSYHWSFNYIETAEIMENIGRDWGYNILSFSDKCGGNTILYVGTLLLRRLIVTQNCNDVGLHCSKRTLNNFLLKIQSQYITNPYHNECHGAQVAHSLHSLATMYFKKSEMASVDWICLIIGGLCHDVGHFGFTNQFLITDNHSLAITYNDMNILENYHSAIAFKTLHLPGCNIFRNMNEKVYRYIRLHVIELILATDMKYHFDYISHLRVRRTAQNFDYIMDENDRWMVLKGCIKFADLSHASLPWHQHRQWSLNLAEEFFRQGDEEIRRGLVVSNLCDRTKFSEFPKSQIGFINFVVFPLAEELFAVDRFGNFKKIVTKNMTQNCEEWMEVERQKFQDKLLISHTSA